MNRQAMRPEFADFIPDALEPGVLYLALEFGAVMHLCASGCGERISTPLHPAQWSMRFDGESVSLSPSIGSGLDCGSHYWIRDGAVVWAPTMTKEQFAQGRARDVSDARRHFGEEVAAMSPTTPTRSSRVTRTLRRLFGRR